MIPRAGHPAEAITQAPREPSAQHPSENDCRQTLAVSLRRFSRLPASTILPSSASSGASDVRSTSYRPRSLALSLLVPVCLLFPIFPVTTGSGLFSDASPPPRYNALLSHVFIRRSRLPAKEDRGRKDRWSLKCDGCHGPMGGG